MTHHAGQQARGIRVLTAVAAAVAVVFLALSFAPARADAAFGDLFGIAPINDGPGPAEESVAFPGGEAWWAGTCEIGEAPAPGGAVAAPGVGTLPTQILAPNSNDGLPHQAPVAAPPLPPHCIDWGAESFYSIAFPNTSLWNIAPAWRLPAMVQAGSHPDGSATFAFRRNVDGIVDGTVDDIEVDLPPGFVGDPNALPKCAAEDFAVKPLRCPPQTQVGVLHLQLTSSIDGNIGGTGANDQEVVPVYNLEPRRGNVAELGIANLGDVNATSARLIARARTAGNFGVTTFIGQIPAALPVISQAITIWGVPWAAAHDRWRTPQGYTRANANTDSCHALPGTASGVTTVLPASGFTTPGCAQSYDPSWGDGVIRPFLTNLTECDPVKPVTDLVMDSFQNQGARTSDGDPVAGDQNWKRYGSEADAVTGCDKPGFEPDGSFVPTSAVAEGAAGLVADIDLPQNRTPPFAPPAVGADQSTIDAYVAAATAHWKLDAGLATSQLDKTVVEFPEGLAVNPGGATGLTSCPDSVVGVRQLGNPPLFNNVDPVDGEGVECPDGSKIGEVEVETPLLDEPLRGEMLLGEPRSTDPTSGDMFRLFLLLRDKERGLVAKVFGSTIADPTTGRLTAVFDNNPRVPFERLRVEIEGGDRGLLALPRSCGEHTVDSVFTPWTAAHGGGGEDASSSNTFPVDQACARGFAPSFIAGMDNREGNGSGRFTFKFGRRGDEQWIGGLTAVLPQGLLGKTKDLPLCTDAQAAAASCPDASRIGTVDATAGAGTPFVIEQKGDAYLTEGYKGCAYGLLVKVRAIAGPFRGPWELSPIAVRQAVCVNSTSAQVTAVADPLPLIHHGVPLRTRDVTVIVDRPGFMRNPSGCSAKRVRANLSSPEGGTASPIVPFQATNCGALGFKPKLTMRLTGRRQMTTGRHPGIKATVVQGGGEAGVRKAAVKLPSSIALDVRRAQSADLCEYEDGTKPDLENRCSKRTIVGRARAVSPLLDRPLTGDVYFVKNVRRSSTGNLIRTLPMIVVALRGEVAINLRGVSSLSPANRLVSTFANVPDAPVSRFDLTIDGGRNGILAVTRTRRNLIDLCARPKLPTAEADFDGHNGRRNDMTPKLKKPCARGGSKKSAKRGRR